MPERSTSLSTQPYIVVSSDGHAGPRLEEDLRPYCPEGFLERFDAWTAQQHNDRAVTEARAAAAEGVIVAGQSYEQIGANETMTLSKQRMALNQRTLGHYDTDTRLREMDYDGVAAEVIFHGSQNLEALPFMAIRDWQTEPTSDKDLALFAVGYEIYNRWLADVVSAAPERLIGLAYLPMWDVDLAIDALTRAVNMGLKGVNLPAPRGGIREYDDPAWEPLWSACEDARMPLVTHAGIPFRPMFGPQITAVMIIESAGWPARRGMHRMILGGVFERHPNLHLIYTELTRGWWAHAMQELDHAYGHPNQAFRNQVPKKPSEYMMNNVFIGASFMPPEEADEAIKEGYSSRIIWGRDYPHGEGTYKFPEHENEESMTRLCYRWTFADHDETEVRAMLGENGIHAFHLNHTALTDIANRIGPRPEDVARPLLEIPEAWHDDHFGFGLK
jgi:predicted TIM-barrel fold metal-dependent hydrolase